MERMIIGGGGAYQKQTVKSEVLQPILQVGVAVLAIGVMTADIIGFLWLIQPTAAMLFFWPGAVFFAWRRNIRGIAICIAAALMTLAGVFCLAWPLYPEGEAWAWARVVLIPVTLFLPVGGYHLVKRMITDARHPNLANSVRARAGTLADGEVRDKIENTSQDNGPQEFDWQ